MFVKKAITKLLTAVAIVLLILPAPSLADTTIKTSPVQATTSASATLTTNANDKFYRAKVTKILDQGITETDGQSQPWQELQLNILDGDRKGESINVNNGQNIIVGTFQKFAPGDQVIVDSPPSLPGQPVIYFIADRYRLPNLIVAALIFLALAAYFGRKRGVTSIIGMAFSVLVIFYYVIPRIVNGGDPFLISVTGSIMIILLSLYLSHGFNKRTSIALASTLLSLGLAVIFDLAFVHFAKLTGSGTEEAAFLQLDGTANINLLGIYLGGIIIGALGVLDDVTTGQAAAIAELRAANPSLDFKKLFKSGLSIGREHIASLINTLVLAYVGISFPLFLFYTSQTMQPAWVVLNSEFVAEEIVRTLVGSSVLVLAVPLTTLLAAFFYSRDKKNKPIVFQNNVDTA